MSRDDLWRLPPPDRRHCWVILLWRLIPDDERYKDLVGKMLKLPLTDREIPVIADEYVDKEFGTGCVKITPAHDPNDFEVGKRHNLEEINILNDDATINEQGGKYAGMDRYEARKAMVKDLEEQGLLVKVVPHSHNVGTHDRCKTTVEPMVKQQWFVKMDEMAKPAIEALKSGRVEIRSRELWKDLSPLAGKYPRLVYFQTALVGPSDSGLLLPGLRGDGGSEGRSGKVPEVRRHSYGTG